MKALPIKTLGYTSFALLAFAGNSVLCRLALGENTIDAASFTLVRLVSGIVVLSAILVLTKRVNGQVSKGSWSAAIMLFLYALTFSFAYISLDTGTGALILFGSVQITMLLVSFAAGHRLHFSEWAGLIIAFSGFVYLVMPSLATPSLSGFALMTIAGVAWAIYTLRGRGSGDPLSDTTYNFLRTLPLLGILLLLNPGDAQLSQTGIFLAVLSGAVASGVGYTIWYLALKGLSLTQAAVVQLLVPVIAALGGVVFASEVISLRLALASILVLGGILTVVMGRYFLAQIGHFNKGS